MKLKYVVFVAILSCINSHAESLIFPVVKMEAQSSIIVIANEDHPIPCPPEHTNLLSNTNLFSPAEREKLEEVSLKYQNVTTTNGAAGSVFEGWKLRRMKQYAGLRVPTNTFLVACFAYTNSGAREEIKSKSPGNITARFRTKAGDGYDVVFAKYSLFAYQEYKHDILDGLFIAVHDPNNANDKEHCGMWTRFINGKILGKFIMWGPNSFTINQSGFKIVAEAEFKEPFDFLKYQSTPFDFAWEEVSSTNHPRSVP